MEESILFFSVTCLLILSVAPPPTSAIFNNICRLFANNTVLRDPYACDAYITCINSVEVSTPCPKGQQFSVATGACVKGIDNCDDPCAPDNDNIWAADPASCNAFYHCNNGVGSFGVCPYDLHFHEDEQQCVYTWNSNCTEKEFNDNYCHYVPNDVPFVDEEYCNKYKICSKHVLQSKTCSGGLTYDRESGKCISIITPNNCRAIPSGICKTIGLSPIIKNKFVSDEATCRGYYYCADKGKEADTEPAWGQCPVGLFFSSSKQSCMDPILVKCAYNRCEGRPDMFVNHSTDCTHYATCEGWITVSVRQCANYKFFDEKRQACTTELIQYEGCKK